MARYVSFDGPDGRQAGLVEGEFVLPVLDVTGSPATSLITVMSGRCRVDDEKGVPLATAVLHAPHVPHRNVMCVGKNYRDHASEFASSGYDSSVDGAEPDSLPLIVFTKATSSIVGPFDEIVVDPTVTSEVDYEGELAVVIGTAGRQIAPNDAWSHIFGYTILNDVTARDLQGRHRQWFLGKSPDTFCPLGPSVVTADDVDASNLQLQTWVNGELRQKANTGELVHDIPTIISVVSASVPLQPGDMIATGTPAGVGIGFTPPRFLADGDVVAIEIDGIGRLENRVRFL